MQEQDSPFMSSLGEQETETEKPRPAALSYKGKTYEVKSSSLDANAPEMTPMEQLKAYIEKNVVHHTADRGQGDLVSAYSNSQGLMQIISPSPWGSPGGDPVGDIRKLVDYYKPGAGQHHIRWAVTDEQVQELEDRPGLEVIFRKGLPSVERTDDPFRTTLQAEEPPKPPIKAGKSLTTVTSTGAVKPVLKIDPVEYVDPAALPTQELWSLDDMVNARYVIEDVMQSYNADDLVAPAFEPKIAQVKYDIYTGRNRAVGEPVPVTVDALNDYLDAKLNEHLISKTQEENGYYLGYMMPEIKRYRDAGLVAKKDAPRNGPPQKLPRKKGHVLSVPNHSSR